MLKVTKKHRVLLFILLFVVCCLLPRDCCAGKILTSKHNLSVGGPGSVKSVTESEICIFCHAPHNASSTIPLWNRYEGGQVYTPYTSTTVKASIGQPTGASKLCLSCHDGTVALGMVRSRSTVILFTQAIGGEQNLGTDLSNDHPISFSYDQQLASLNPRLNDPSSLTGPVRLDENSQLQCTSCHDPHNDQFEYFIRVDPARGNLCITCHNMDGWDGCAHKTSSASWNGASPDPWPHTGWNTVSDNACESCHISHNAPGKKRLLNFATEEDNCITCHNGNVAQKNISSELNKAYKHSVYSYTGLHDAAENTIVTSKRHIECQDCHNPHSASSSSGPLPGSLSKVKGVNAQGSEVAEISYGYELCFRCHGDSNYAANIYVTRQFAENNTRLEFAPSNSSFHPIENIGKNPDMPSLKTPYTISSILKCGDCHNNNAGPGAGGTGPNGPHASVYSALLERNLSFADNQTESLSAYALCYKCHDRTNILDDKSFPTHKKHISDKKSPCTACHDPHGVTSKEHLINFDRNIVSENSSNQLSFTDSGRLHGSCSLKCHNYNHNNKSY